MIGRPSTPNPWRPRPSVARLALLLGVAFLAVPGVLAHPTAHLAPTPTGSGTAPTARPGNEAPAISGLAPNPGVGALSWIPLLPPANSSSPPGGPGATLAYDPALGEYVLFGGCLADCAGNQTWLFHQGVWVNVTHPGDAPPARIYAAMDFDANAGGVLLFGGLSAAGQLLNDTWLFRGGFWTNVTYLSPAPSARYGPSLAFDPDPEENASVLVGGCDFISVPPCHADAYTWQPGAGWTALNTSFSPAPRGFGALAYSPPDHALVYFGGYGACGFLCPLNDTWELYGATWWAIRAGAENPSARSGAVMTYDPALDGLLLFAGGSSGSGPYVNDSFAFTGGAWHALVVPAPPAARWGAAMSADSTGTAPVLWGGQAGSGAVSDLWALEPNPGVSLSAPTSRWEVAAPAPFTVTPLGGTGPYTVSIDFGDHSSALRTSLGEAAAFTHTYRAPGTYTIRATSVDGLGLSASGTATGTATLRLVAGPVVVAGVHPAGGDAGLPVQLTATVVNQSAPPGTFTWVFGDGSNATGANVSHGYANVAVYSVSVQYLDPLGASAEANLTVPIAALPSATIGMSGSFLSGNATAFYGNVTGGTCPCSYAWVFGDGGTSPFPDPTHTYASGGHYGVELWVNDSAGGKTHAIATVTVAQVSPPGTSASGTPSPPVWFWPGIAGLAVLAVAGSVLLLRRGRR
ncbi:MAG TPA: PKD domain-containing protein [Thermoplasmata archaeon]|nr:PKD domain-containing protein [Thermoplasmata archaeon]